MLPFLKTKIKTEEKTVKVFGGINLSEDWKTGELISSRNITSKSFPALSCVGGKKKIYEAGGIINGIYSHDELVYTWTPEDGKSIRLTYAGEDYEFSGFSSSEDFFAKRKITSLAKCLLIIPDNVLFFTNTRSFLKICVSNQYTPQSAWEKYNSESPDVSDISVDDIGGVARLTSSSLRSLSESYYYGKNHELYFLSFDKSLKAGDVVIVKGSAYSSIDSDYPEFYEYRKKLKNGLSLKIKALNEVTHSTPNGEITEITELVFDDNAIDTEGFTNIYFSSLTVERGMPALENVCSHANRIWGISGNEIFTSKLSDASEWNDYSSDSYGTLPYACFNTATETQGDFCAIIPFNHYVYAFKESSIAKIYGDSPDEYSIYSKDAPGIKKELSTTLCVCDDCLIYASDDGIYMYTDSGARLISVPIDDIGEPICAAYTNQVYYLLTQKNDEKLIFTYDTKKDIWHSLTAIVDAKFLCSHSGTVYMAGESEIYALEHSQSEESASWEFSLRLDDRLFGKKSHTRLLIRYSLKKGASFSVLPIYDDDIPGRVCAVFHDKTFSGEEEVFLPRRRCSSLTLKFWGRGDFTLNTIRLIYTRGSEIK